VEIGAKPGEKLYEELISEENRLRHLMLTWDASSTSC